MKPKFNKTESNFLIRYVRETKNDGNVLCPHLFRKNSPKGVVTIVWELNDNIYFWDILHRMTLWMWSCNRKSLPKWELRTGQNKHNQQQFKRRENIYSKRNWCKIAYNDQFIWLLGNLQKCNNDVKFWKLFYNSLTCLYNLNKCEHKQMYNDKMLHF